jgi:ribosomal-protein-alanine acetyltransferase
MDTVLRPIAAADLDQLTDLNLEHDDLVCYMKSEAFWGIVALDLKIVSGMIYGWKHGGQVEIIQIMVHPDCRRSGLGTRLLHHFIDDANARTCRLEVRADNIQARSFYRKFGFVEDGVRENYYRDQGGRTDAILMTYDHADAEGN